MSNDISVRIAKVKQRIKKTDIELTVLKQDLECVKFNPSYNVLYNMYRNKKRKQEIDKATLATLQKELGV